MPTSQAPTAASEPGSGVDSYHRLTLLCFSVASTYSHVQMAGTGQDLCHGLALLPMPAASY